MKSFIYKFRHQSGLYSLISLAVLAAALFFVYRIVNAGLIALPYPKEILEPSNIVLTNEFLAGRSPYTADAVSRPVPGINYDYPFLNSLIAAGIAYITGCSAVTAHFAISLASILGSAVIGFAMTSRALAQLADKKENAVGLTGSGNKASGEREKRGGKTGTTTIAPILAALIFMFCHFRYGYISAAPDDLGLFLLLLTCAAAVSPRIKNKPFVCALGITLCFYTKQYLVFVAAGLFIYMLLYRVRDAIKLFFWTLAINVLAVGIITNFWPLYWTKAFFFTYLGTAVGGGGLISTLADQFIYLMTIFGPLFAVILIAVIWSVFTKRRSGRDKKIKENDVFIMSVVQSIVMMAPLAIIGRNDGAFLSYFLQLWMPFVTIVALICFEDIGIPKSDTSKEIAAGKLRQLVHATVYVGIAAFIIYFGFGRLPLHVLTQEEIANWQKADEIVSRCAENGEVFYARSLAYMSPEGDADPEDRSLAGGDCICGHDGEVNADTVTALTGAGLPDEFTRFSRQLVDQNLVYREGIEDKAAAHTYSLITFDVSGAYTPFSEEICEKSGYRCTDRIELQLGNMPYEVLFYQPF
ncbi:MAG: hypothetical protein K6F28_05115 [Lachnospiraceae bacterium]|nr:hypothetical protein [Lachnospiraceae bacterium]